MDFLTDFNLFSVVLIIAITVLAIVIICIYCQPDMAMMFAAKTWKNIFWFANTRENVCALTIDDTPSAATAEILDVLKAYGVKATFFVISGHIPGHENIIRRIVTEGHTLGNHMTEDCASIKYSAADFESKLLECDAVIKKYQTTSPDETKWMRPGSGWFNSSMCSTLKAHDYRLCLGNVYPHDAQISSVSINSFFLRKRTRPGSILIVHDRPWTVEVLKTSLPDLVQRFSFVSLSELQDYDQKQL